MHFWWPRHLSITDKKVKQFDSKMSMLSAMFNWLQTVLYVVFFFFVFFVFCFFLFFFRYIINVWVLIIIVYDGWMFKGEWLSFWRVTSKQFWVWFWKIKVLSRFNEEDVWRSQTVTSPTRGKHILALVFTSNLTLIDSVSIWPGLSYHDIVRVLVNIIPSQAKQVPHNAPFYKKKKRQIGKSLNTHWPCYHRCSRTVE